jgi:hypothetical protein
MSLVGAKYPTVVAFNRGNNPLIFFAFSFLASLVAIFRILRKSIMFSQLSFPNNLI